MYTLNWQPPYDWSWMLGFLAARAVNGVETVADDYYARSLAVGDAPRDKCTLSCAINGIHAAFHYLKKNYISGCVMTVPTGW